MAILGIDGYLFEIFSSFQGEGGSIWGSCFGKRQIFVRYAGCNLVEGDFKSDGCFWCDSPQAQWKNASEFKHEAFPGSQTFKKQRNPADIKTIIEIIKNLITPDLHSISFTGGEPLHQVRHVIYLANELRKGNVNYPLYLETNGTILLNQEEFSEITKNFGYCCCDIKDKSSRAVSVEKWEELVNKELKFIKMLVSKGVKTFAKMVITAKTAVQDIRWISEKLANITNNNGQSVGLAIQPVTIEDDDLIQKYGVSNEHLNELFYAAAEFLEPSNLTLSVQAHKFLNLL